VFERFTEQAYQVVDLGREEAEGLGHRYLGPEHLLLGILRDGTSGAAQLLRAYGIQLETARAELLSLARQGVVPPPRPSPATGRCLARWALTWRRSGGPPSRPSAPPRWGRRPGG